MLLRGALSVNAGRARPQACVVSYVLITYYLPINGLDYKVIPFSENKSYNE